MSHTHRKHASDNKRPDRPGWMSRRQTQDDERWALTWLGELELIMPGHYTDPEDEFFALYEDADQRLGGHDNPYQEDHDAS